MNQRGGPIGVFDSGVGGLAILRELRQLLPAEDYIYFADQENFPYGPRSVGEVRALAVAVADDLIERGAKLLVVACNTASGAALTLLRERFAIPIVGIEPALKPACALTRNGRVGVLATSGTVQGQRLDELAERVAGEVQIIRVAAPELVELVERGDANSSGADSAVAERVRPLIDAGVDVVVLGCTHFAFVRDAIARALGPDVQVLEPAAAVARHAAGLLVARGLENDQARRGTTRLLSSGDPASLARAADQLGASACSVNTAVGA